MTDADRIKAALDVAAQYGMFDGAHHKQWVVDQMVRRLLGRDYEAWVERMNSGPGYAEWDVGVAP